ncbi:MAG: cell division protein [Flavobacterium sp. BFFFF1]|uniref:SRPBCC family protein n=1 Tax=Flavobacterium sp. BFFFF1 TaxID=2015557 RepID=UPI000BD199FE|nr:SRPBCC family protein [Flavobacterium sp. BFFFF1]OYU79529.1 MAG: cell division protein [Flavobacterium sp. BFFFF1]
MTTIKLDTIINAPMALVFDISRDLDIHLKSTQQTQEKIIAGKSSGLIALNETVTWKAKHFGFWLTHQSRITEMQFPLYFVDEMEKGNFKSFRHEHAFTEKNGLVIMSDRLQYETPYGIFGKLFDRLLLKKYLTNFISRRNVLLKQLSEQQHQNPPENRNGFHPERSIIS